MSRRCDCATYSVAKIGDSMAAGMFDMGAMPGMEGVPPQWMTYLAVYD